MIEKEIAEYKNNNILNGKILRDNIFYQIKEYIKQNSLYNKLCFAILSIGDDEASKIYIKQKEKMANLLNINISKIEFQKDVSEEEVLNKIHDLNEDKNINGIIIQLPIPKHLSKDKLINSIKPEKDIDGLRIYKPRETFFR